MHLLHLLTTLALILAPKPAAAWTLQGSTLGRLLLQEEPKCTKEVEKVCRDVEDGNCDGAVVSKCYEVPMEECGPVNSENCWMETKRGCAPGAPPQCRTVQRQNCGDREVQPECRTVTENQCRRVPREQCPLVESCRLVRRSTCDRRRLLGPFSSHSNGDDDDDGGDSDDDDDGGSSRSVSSSVSVGSSSSSSSSGWGSMKPPSSGWKKPPPPPPRKTPPPPRQAPPTTRSPQRTSPPAPPQGSSDDGDDDDDGGDDDDGFLFNDDDGFGFGDDDEENEVEEEEEEEESSGGGNFFDCPVNWERVCDMVPPLRDCEECGLVEQTVCGDQVMVSDCPVVEEQVCEPAQEQDCTDFQVQRCETLETRDCQTVMKQECKSVPDPSCVPETTKKCEMEERERCVLGIEDFEYALQSVNVKLASDYLRANNDPALVATALSFKPEDREEVLRKTPERVGDPDVVVGKAFATAVVGSESPQAIADRLARITIEAILQDIWVVSFFIDLQQLERDLRTVFADQNKMQAIIDANPAADLLPRTEGRRRLECVNCTPLHSVICAHCWPSNACSLLWWCPSYED